MGDRERLLRNIDRAGEATTELVGHLQTLARALPGLADPAVLASMGSSLKYERDLAAAWVNAADEADLVGLSVSDVFALARQAAGLGGASFSPVDGFRNEHNPN